MKRLLCFGDSNTYGYRPVEGRFAYETRWTGQLAARLGADWQLIEAGLNGRTAGHYDDIWPELNGVDVIAAYVRRCAPLSLVLVMLGSNDVVYAPAEQAAADLGLLLDQLLSALDGSAARVLVLAPPVGQFPRLGYPGAARLAPLYRQLAKERGLCFADAGRWPLEMKDDGCHLTAADHRVFAGEVYRSLQELALL